MHNEVRVFLSPDHRGRIAVVRRSDGLFCLYEHWHWSIEAQRAMRIEPLEDRRWSTDFDPALYEDKSRSRGCTERSPMLRTKLGPGWAWTTADHPTRLPDLIQDGTRSRRSLEQSQTR